MSFDQQRFYQNLHHVGITETADDIDHRSSLMKILVDAAFILFPTDTRGAESLVWVAHAAFQRGRAYQKTIEESPGSVDRLRHDAKGEARGNGCVRSVDVGPSEADPGETT